MQSRRDSNPGCRHHTTSSYGCGTLPPPARLRLRCPLHMPRHWSIFTGRTEQRSKKTASSSTMRLQAKSRNAQRLRSDRFKNRTPERSNGTKIQSHKNAQKHFFVSYVSFLG